MLALAPPPVPRHAYELDLKIGAHSREELVSILRSIETQLTLGQSVGTDAGRCSLTIDETMTRERWERESHAYAVWLSSPERISDSF